MPLRFAEIPKLISCAEASERGIRAAELFNAVVARTCFRLFRPGDPVPAHGKRVLYGCANYAQPTLTFLDSLDARLRATDPLSIQVDVFDIDSCHSPEELWQYLPGSRITIPVAGLWRDGSLLERSYGTHVYKDVPKWLGLTHGVVPGRS